jgi:hypothetical protein
MDIMILRVGRVGHAVGKDLDSQVDIVGYEQDGNRETGPP